MTSHKAEIGPGISHGSHPCRPCTPPLGGCKDQIGHGCGFGGHPCILADLAGVRGVAWFFANSLPINWLLMPVSPLFGPQKKVFSHPCILAASLHPPCKVGSSYGRLSSDHPCTPPFRYARMVNCCKVCKVCKDLDLMRVWKHYSHLM